MDGGKIKGNIEGWRGGEQLIRSMHAFVTSNASFSPQTLIGVTFTLLRTYYVARRKRDFNFTDTSLFHDSITPATPFYLENSSHPGIKPRNWSEKAPPVV